jgi:hypothetical protein
LSRTNSWVLGASFECRWSVRPRCSYGPNPRGKSTTIWESTHGEGKV